MKKKKDNLIRNPIIELISFVVGSIIGTICSCFLLSKYNLLISNNIKIGIFACNLISASLSVLIFQLFSKNEK